MQFTKTSFKQIKPTNHQTNSPAPNELIFYFKYTVFHLLVEHITITCNTNLFDLSIQT